MEAKTNYSDVREWIGSALDLSSHADGATHAAADGTMAIGMQQGPREEQQDCGAALLWLPRGILSPHCAAVVADGMGGMEDGGWASRRAVEIVVERCLAGDHDTPRDMLADALYHAQREVLEALKGRGGTTLTAAVWKRQHGMLVHVGDTRAHLIERGRPFRCLTGDHTRAGLADTVERLTAGSPAEPYRTEEPYRPIEPDNSLLDAIGIPEGILAERHVLHTPAEGRVVMTSDGAHDPIRGAGTAAFEEQGDEERWTAQRSVEAIWDRLAGETLTDNATVVAIEPGRALQHAEERFMEKELRFGEVVLVGPTGVLRETLER